MRYFCLHVTELAGRPLRGRLSKATADRSPRRTQLENHSAMPHADSLALPSETLTKREFYAHVCVTAEALLAPANDSDPAANWITVLSNAASLLYGSYENYSSKFGREDGRKVNWAGERPADFPSTTVVFPQRSATMKPSRGPWLTSSCECSHPYTRFLRRALASDPLRRS